MSATSSPFGLRPIYHPTGLDRAREYSMLPAYATPIYKNSPVALVGNQINLASAGAFDLLGSFGGVTYTDITGKPTVSNSWPGVLTGATNITAWVFDDPMNVYEIQSTGSIAANVIGQQVNLDATSVGTGSASTGLSAAMCNTALVTAGSQGQLQILDFSMNPSNAAGDAFTVVQVRIARHQFVANKVAV